jgi:hypothetical protein
MTQPPQTLLVGLILAFHIFGADKAYAQSCPDAQAGKTGFVVERGERSRTEVFHNGPVVRTVLRYGGNTLLETTQYEGLFELDRLDRGRRSAFKPKSDLVKLFPLKLNQRATAEFDIEDEAGPAKKRTVVLLVKGQDELYLGACKYKVLKIERSQTQTSDPPSFMNVDYYAPDLKLIIAKEYKESGGRTNLIKFDKIYLSGN